MNEQNEPEGVRPIINMRPLLHFENFITLEKEPDVYQHSFSSFKKLLFEIENGHVKVVAVLLSVM